MRRQPNYKLVESRINDARLVRGEPTPLFEFALGIADNDWRQSTEIFSLLKVLIIQMAMHDNPDTPTEIVERKISHTKNSMHREIKEVLNK